MKICVFGASSSTIDKDYIEQIEKLGFEIARRGHTLIYGAGASGLMGAAARGAYENGGDIIGVVPNFFEEEDMGVDGKIFENCTKLITTETMRDRKKIMEDMADAFIVAPGGIGTFEEFFEVLTLKQLERHNKAIAVFNINGYYNDMMNMLDKAVEKNFLRRPCLNLFHIFDKEEGILSYLENYDEAQIKLSDMKDVK